VRLGIGTSSCWRVSKTREDMSVKLKCTGQGKGRVSAKSEKMRKAVVSRTILVQALILLFAWSYIVILNEIEYCEENPALRIEV
jgi:hypothetical protein